MQQDDLPPLPRPDLGMPWRVNAVSDGAAHSSGFTHEQMRAYARQVQAAERERMHAAYCHSQQQFVDAASVLSAVREDLAQYSNSDDDRISVAMRRIDMWRDGGPNVEFSGSQRRR